MSIKDVLKNEPDAVNAWAGEMKESQPDENIIPLALKICRRLLGPRLWGCTPDGGWTRPAVVVHEGQYYYKNSEKVMDEPMSTEAHLSNRFEDDLKAGIYVASGDFETEEDIKM